MESGVLIMNELVSVVVTCYNHEAYIRQCLESIFKQTEKNIELIVFNDGSTDSSDKIISETLKNSPFKVTKYILQKNKGLVVTRNQAFDLITGKFLLFVDSDNFLEPNYIESMLTEANNKKADIIYTRLINPDNGTVVHDIIPFDLKTFYKFNFIDSCSMVRVSKIKDVRYDEFLNYKKLEDYDFFWNLIVNNNAVPVPTNKTHLNYRVLENSLSARNSLKKYFDAYAYILSKYAGYDRNFVEEALIYNFDLLNLEESYQNQFITVYFDKGKGFSEEDKLCYPITYQGKVSISIPKQVSAVRFDITEKPIFLERLTIKIRGNEEILTPDFTNGLFIENGAFFPEIDPIIIYEDSSLADNILVIDYKIYNLSNIYHKDYVVKRLVSDYSQLSAEYNKTKNELQSQKQLYQSIVNSRRWKYMSKLIDFIRRKK